MKRSHLLATLGAAAVARPRVASAQNTAIRIGVAPIEESALPYYAVQKGFFKQNGIDAEINVSAGGGGAITAAIVGGSLDLGCTNTGSLASAHVHGLPVYLLALGALYTPAAPISHLCVVKSLGIKSAKDLSGKTLGVSTIHDMLQTVTLAWIDQNGGDSKAVKFVEITASEIPAAMKAGRLDGGLLNEPFYTEAKDDVQLLGLPYEAMAGKKPFQTFGLAANRDWVARNPGVAKSIVTALQQTARWVNRNHAETTALLASYVKIDPAVAAQIPRVAYAESNNPAYVQPVVDLMTRYAVLPNAFPARELFPAGI
ncbi:MAG TPA: ABC transporter substrate-binding protein [Candidatus Lustribacter sp.]|jgi:NitT/TauT family transport system substrate-binding protein|nr:ABC transporter substrate-binding protein [Candidatus Lustribacter sp.]